MTDAPAPKFVYFIQSLEGGPVKIGFALRPDRRLASLQIDNPQEMCIRAVALGGSVAERLLHNHFAEHRIRGEWFSPVPELVGLMAKLPSWEAVAGGAYCPEIVNTEARVLHELHLMGYSLEDCAEVCSFTKQHVSNILFTYRDRHYSYDEREEMRKSRPPKPDEPIRDAFDRLSDKHTSIDIVLKAK